MIYKSIAFFFIVVKHANVDHLVGANENSTYPNITLREDVNLLDLSVNGQLKELFSFRKIFLNVLGQYVIPLSYVLQLLKLAFNYQVYEIFEPLMEPISDLVGRTDGSQTSLLALLQILYEIEQCEKERKAAQNVKITPASKAVKDTDKKKQRGTSPPKGKEAGTAARKKSPDLGKTKLKPTKAIKDLINAAKATRIPSGKDVQIKIDQAIDEEEQERTVEELLEDLCFLLLTDPQIVCIYFDFFNIYYLLFV
jgi:hypothetical protein